MGPDKADVYGEILRKWACSQHAGHQCYRVEEDGEETLHVALTNDIMSEWADKCVCA